MGIRSDSVTPGNLLAGYWLDIPADWASEKGGWLMSVYQFDKAQFEGLSGSEDGTTAWDLFAQDETFYYAILRPADGWYSANDQYWDACRALRAYVEKKLLETEGVEPYTPAQPADSLRERLQNIPQTLRNDVVLRDVDIPEDGSVLWAVGYWMNRPEWEELDAGLGWLLNIQQISQAEYEAHIGRDNSRSEEHTSELQSQR